MFILDVLKKYKIHHIIFSIILLVLSQLILNYLPFQLPNYDRMLISVLFISLYYILTSIVNNHISSFNLFATIMCFGVIVSLIKPVQVGLDEETHLFNTISLADSFVLKRANTEYYDYNSVLNHDILRNPDNYKADKYWRKVEHRKTKVEGKIVGYNSIVYFPAAIGWKLGSLFSKKIIVSYYLGRIFNILAFAILAAIAFRISKYYKDAIYFFSCLPFSIHLCSSYQYDNIYLGISLITIALLTNLYVEDQSISYREIILFNLVCFCFSFSKIPYVLLGALLILFPTRCFKENAGRLVSMIVFFVQLICSFATMFVINIGKVPLIEGETPNIIFFIKHPLPFIRTLFDIVPNSIENIANPIVVPIVPSRFLSIITIFIFFMVVVLISANLEFKIDRIGQLVIFGLFITISGAIIYAISGDLRVFKMGDINVGGVQGRYFFFMLLSLPAFLSHDIQKYLCKGKYKLDSFLYYCITYLNILTVGVMIYSQIAHKL